MNALPDMYARSLRAAVMSNMFHFMALLKSDQVLLASAHSIYMRIYSSRGDYKFAEMIGQKQSIAILSLNLVGHPYIALEW